MGAQASKTILAHCMAGQAHLGLGKSEVQGIWGIGWHMGGKYGRA